QTPQARHRRRFLVLVQLWVEVPLAVAGAVAGENNTVVSAVDGGDVVVVRRLVGNFDDHRDGGGIGEVGDFEKLPIIDRAVVVLKARGTHDHAENRLRSAPVHARLADGNAIGVLRAVRAESRSAGEVPNR